MYQKNLYHTSSYQNNKENHFTQHTSLNQSKIQPNMKSNIQQGQQKSMCQKYLNIYESIKRKQSSQIIEKLRNSSIINKKTIPKKKGIFQNHLIQNKCPKKLKLNGNQKQLSSSTNQQENIKNQIQKGASFRNVSIASKKNQVALEMIAENKFLPQKQKQNKLPIDLYINGQQILQTNVANFQNNFLQKLTNSIQINQIKTIDALNMQQKTQQLLKKQKISNAQKLNKLFQSYSYWKTNLFTGFDTKKAYGGYFKAKNKKKYQKQRSKCEAISKQFINKIDKSISYQKVKRLILRPKTCDNTRLNNLSSSYSQLNKNVCKNNKKYGIQQKSMKIQSEATRISSSAIDKRQSQSINLRNTQTHNRVTYFGLVRKSKSNTMINNSIGFLFNGKQNQEFERKNAKKYTFHSKIHSPTRKHYNPNNSTQIMHDPIQANNNSCMKQQNNQQNQTFGIITQQRIRTVQKKLNQRQNKRNNYSPRQQNGSNELRNSYLQSKKIFQKKHKNKKSYDSSNFNLTKQSSSTYHSRNRTNRSYMTLNKIQYNIENDLQLMIKHVQPEAKR